jgi:hypothetical protein
MVWLIVALALIAVMLFFTSRPDGPRRRRSGWSDSSAGGWAVPFFGDSGSSSSDSGSSSDGGGSGSDGGGSDGGGGGCGGGGCGGGGD